MDLLDEILRSLRLTGGVVIDGEFSGDFCILAQFTPKHFAPFFPQPERLISYHYVRSGSLIIEVVGREPQVIRAGSIALLPRNDAHTLASRAGLTPTDAGIVWITKDGVHRVTIGTSGEPAEIWCGFLGTQANAHPLLDALPELLTLNVTGGEAQWLDSSMRFLSEEQPSAEVVAKLAELFLAQSIREYVESLPPDASGWLKGLVFGAWRALHRADRRAADALLRALADARRRQHAAGVEREHRECRLCRRVQQRSRV
jgi:hypothetical protein